MTIRNTIVKIVQQEDLNFLLTNRIPRRLLTRFMGWISQVEYPPVRDFSMRIWRLFSDLDLSDAAETHFRSVHHCFTRRLRDGARPVDPDPELLVSPCDALVGACGKVEGTRVLQVKGFPYPLHDLLGDDRHAEIFKDGCYVTLRLTSSMYHRFHAPHDCYVDSVTYISGDTWNVNPIALKRVESLFCKNERALIRAHLSATGHAITMVPVAAILVAGIRFHFVNTIPDPADQGPRTVHCAVSLRKGEEMGWFQHGSTIILFAPAGFELCDGVREGVTIRVGQPLLRLSTPARPTMVAR